MSYNTLQAAADIVGEVELYTFTTKAGKEYYTSGPKDITLSAGNPLNDTGASLTFTSYPISRDKVSSTAKAKPSSVKISLPILSSMQDIAIAGSLGVISVDITRGFGDPETSPENFSPSWFSGTMVDLETGNSVLTGTLQDVLFLLNTGTLPKPKISRFCEWGLFETSSGVGKCDLNKADFQYTLTVGSIQDSGRTLKLLGSSESPSGSGWAAADADGAPGQFSLGEVVNSAIPSETSMILEHTADATHAYIGLLLPLPSLLAGDSVIVSWGCDKRPSTCKTKFNNWPNFWGCPKLPTTNPAVVATFNKTT